MTRTLRRFCVLLAAAALTPACSDKEEPGYTPPETAAQTHLMYMPWSGNLTSYFRTNIEDMARVVAEGIPADVRVLVYFMESPDEASLFELYRRGGRCERLTLRTYDPAPDFTAAEGIASVLGDVKREAPALRYSMSIGSHGMAWLPAVSSVPGRATAPARREYWEHAAPNRPLTRWFGGTSPDHRTEIATLAEALARTGLHMEYILFDDCYMSSVEVAYELRGVTDYLIGSTSEIMAYGFPYASAGRHMLGEVDYEGICDAFHAFYSTYTYPYGTIGVTRCAGLEKFADIMRRINAAHAFDPGRLGDLQRLDGYTPTLFFDLGDYVRRLCSDDDALLAEFEKQLDATVPWHRHTEEYYSMANGVNPIRTFSGITTSDPSADPEAAIDRQQTAWWRATH